MKKMDTKHWVLLGLAVAGLLAVVAAGTEMLAVDGFINRVFGWGSYKPESTEEEQG